MGNLSVHCEAVSEILIYLFHYKTLDNRLQSITFISRLMHSIIQNLEDKMYVV